MGGLLLLLEDALFDIRDYRMLLASSNGDLRRADDAFNSMLSVRLRKEKKMKWNEMKWNEMKGCFI